MNQIMLITNTAAASITHPSTMSELYAVCATTTATADAGHHRRPQRPEDRPLQLRPPNLAQVGKDDPDDQRRFHPFAERDDKCLQHNVFLFLWESSSASPKTQLPGNLHEAGAALVPLSSVLRTNLVVNPSTLVLITSLETAFLAYSSLLQWNKTIAILAHMAPVRTKSRLLLALFLFLPPRRN